MYEFIISIDWKEFLTTLCATLLGVYVAYRLGIVNYENIQKNEKFGRYIQALRILRSENDRNVIFLKKIIIVEYQEIRKKNIINYLDEIKCSNWEKYEYMIAANANLEEYEWLTQEYSSIKIEIIKLRRELELCENLEENNYIINETKAKYKDITKNLDNKLSNMNKKLSSWLSEAEKKRSERKCRFQIIIEKF